MAIIFTMSLLVLMSFTTLFQSRYSRLGKYGVDYPYFQMSCSYVMLIAMSNNSPLSYMFSISRSGRLCIRADLRHTGDCTSGVLIAYGSGSNSRISSSGSVSAISGVSPG